MPKPALVLLAAVLALMSGVAEPAVAGARADVNEALAVNTTDGSSVFELAVSIRRTADVDVNPVNVALAYARCESCQTVAMAFQVVLAVGPAATVEASNTAVAVNDRCRDCETFAAAYQFVVVTGRPVRFTREGWREIKSIYRELRSLRRSGLLASELRERVNRLAIRLQQAVTTELRSSRPGHLRASRSRLEAGIVRHDQSLPDRAERREAHKHARHQPGSLR
jgi:hypothetical protein